MGGDGRTQGAREVSSCLFEFVKKALEAETPAGVKELPLEDWDVMWRPRPVHSERILVCRHVPRAQNNPAFFPLS